MAEDDKQQQDNEILLLQGMYPEEFYWIEKQESKNLKQCPKFGIRLTSDYALTITLPPGYPSVELPRMFLECGETVARTEREKLRAEVKSELDKFQPGFPLLDTLIPTISSLLPCKPSEQGAKQDTTPQVGNSATCQQTISRAVIWSHHIRSPHKRRDIVTWSKELRLDGFSRPGWPGAVIVEGDQRNVHEFIVRLKGLTWQALQVRGEESGTERLLEGGGKGVTEVEAIGEIVTGLKECRAGPAEGQRLAEWFLEEMKIK
ncbi:hypothetical protein BDZ91DRAFT_850925 [Kalaharituber pfeilii]|nr:hypothetical protein BDZ91DRAFT_850925 [Kalaharituber pfeilii]